MANPEDHTSRSTSSLNSPYKSSSSFPRPPLSQSSSCHFSPAAAFGPCAACKFHNRQCSENCYLASFFPPEEVHKFAVVDSVFGTANFVNFLQQNSNSSYIPLLFLLRDTSKEDEEVHSHPNYNTLSQTNIHKQPGAVTELIQGRETGEQLKEPLLSTRLALDMIWDHLFAIPESDHFDAAKERTLTTWTEHFRVSLGNELPRYPDDGFSWTKYEINDPLGAKYPRCTYEYSQNCSAGKEVKRSDKDPTIFEVEYQGFHSCLPPVCPEKQQEEQNNISSRNQQPQNAQLEDPEFSFQPIEVDTYFPFDMPGFFS